MIKSCLFELSLQESRTSLFNITAQGTLKRGKPSTMLQKFSLKIVHYCQRLECCPAAAQLGTSHLYLGCRNATLSPTHPHPQQDATSSISGTEREQAPASLPQWRSKQQCWVGVRTRGRAWWQSCSSLPAPYAIERKVKEWLSAVRYLQAHGVNLHAPFPPELFALLPEPAPLCGLC